MSSVTKTKSELFKENELLRNLLLRIHQLTSPFFDINANETSNNGTATKTPSKEVPQRTRKRSKLSVMPLANVAKQNTMIMKPKVLLHKIDDIAADQSNSETDGDEHANEDENVDDMLTYLRLHKVSYDKKRPRLAHTEPPSNASTPSNQSKPMVCLNTVTVLLDRLSPSDIQKALGMQTAAPKQQSIQPARQSLPRKAAPTNLKEMSAKDMEKLLKS